MVLMLNYLPPEHNSRDFNKQVLIFLISLCVKANCFSQQTFMMVSQRGLGSSIKFVYFFLFSRRIETNILLSLK